MKTKGFESIIQQKPDNLKHMSDEEYLKYYIGVGVCNSLNAKALCLRHVEASWSRNGLPDIVLLSLKASNDISNLLKKSQELIRLMEDRIEELENELGE